MKIYFTAFVIIVMVIAAQFLSCSKEETTAPSTPTVPYKTTPYSLNVPSNFPPPLIPDSNKMTVEGVKLGRMLYYDPILSTNGMSCSSCHQQSRAFTSPYIVLNGETLSVKPHINIAWNPNLLWDGSEPSPESVCLLDFGPAFFNTDTILLVKKLKNSSTYPLLFYQAFGVTDFANLTSFQLKVKIVEAVSQFVRTMISANSKFDRFIRHEDNLSVSEMNGYLIFMTEKGDCFHCHGTILFTDNTFNNTGLSCNPSGQDQGRYLVTGKESDKGKFLAPTLRNIALTAPYMHDGRFKTLQEVIEYYNSGVCQTSPNIDPLMTLPAKKYGLQLTSQDKTDLLNFLLTLTDSSFITNPDFASPF